MQVLPKRPPDWDWITAVYQCSPEEMFVKLRELAKRDVTTRNTQLGEDLFSLRDTDGGGFSVSRRHGDTTGHIAYFLIDDHEKDVRVRVSRTALKDPVFYAVRLDSDGHCKFYDTDTNTPLDPWQVLRQALESILFW